MDPLHDNLALSGLTNRAKGTYDDDPCLARKALLASLPFPQRICVHTFIRIVGMHIEVAQPRRRIPHQRAHVPVALAIDRRRRAERADLVFERALLVLRNVAADERLALVCVAEVARATRARVMQQD